MFPPEDLIFFNHVVVLFMGKFVGVSSSARLSSDLVCLCISELDFYSLGVFSHMTCQRELVPILILICGSFSGHFTLLFLVTRGCSSTENFENKPHPYSPLIGVLKAMRPLQWCSLSWKHIFAVMHSPPCEMLLLLCIILKAAG